MYSWIAVRLGNRKTLSAVLIVIIMFLVLAVPGLLFAKSLYEGVAFLKTQYEASGSIIPGPSEKVADWPVVGSFIFEKWNWISQHLGDALKEYAPQIKQVLFGLFSSAASAGAAFLKLIISIIIAGLLLVSSTKAGKLANEVFIKLIGEKGKEFAEMAEKTIRTVIKGIVGVAFIQSTLFGIGMVAAGVPAAGLWFILSLNIWYYSDWYLSSLNSGNNLCFCNTEHSCGSGISDLDHALVSLVDNILKPILFGQGTVLPMPVIFIGAIGGFIASGLVGLFTGAVVFSVGYKLFLFWLEEKNQETEKN